MLTHEELIQSFATLADTQSQLIKFLIRGQKNCESFTLYLQTHRESLLQMYADTSSSKFQLESNYQTHHPLYQQLENLITILQPLADSIISTR